MEASNLPDTEFKRMVIRMFKKLNENFNKETTKKDIATIKKNQSEMKNTISEINNALERLNSRLNEAEG